MAGDETCANPLLLQWLKEWLDTAKERNSKGVTMYNKAYKSMKACPMKFSHPSEAQQLHGIGPKLCDRLTEKLREHCAEEGIEMPQPAHRRGRKRASDGVEAGEEDEDQPAPVKKARKPKTYVPRLNSGAYAIVVALASLGEDSNRTMNKQEVIAKAQPHCESSFTAPSDARAFYTAWNSMKTLVEKELVWERGRPLTRYSLTDAGWETARAMKTGLGNAAGAEREAEAAAFLMQDEPANRSVPISGHRLSDAAIGAPDSYKPEPVEEPIVASRTARKPSNFISLSSDDEFDAVQRLESTEKARSAQPSAQSTGAAATSAKTTSTAVTPSFTPIRVPAGSYDVQLVLDTREVRTKSDRDYMSNELAKKNVPVVTRALELGDALWVAKLKHPNFLHTCSEEGDEIALDWIVERKRLDDLIYSIKDGRFHEQKFRLRRSGVKHVIYIIEECRIENEALGKYAEAVASSIAGTQVVNEFFVKRTQKMDETIRYLARMTLYLQKLYEKRDLWIIPTKAIASTRTYLPLLKALETSLLPAYKDKNFNITYATLSLMSSKSDTMALRDLFIKMLMCTRGITGDKAIEIQKIWKTPRDFIEAFLELESESGLGSGTDLGGRKKKGGKETMVSEKLDNLVGRKAVKGALAKKVAEIWGGAVA